MEHKILAACCQSRDNWEQIKGLTKEQRWSPEGGVIYGLISEYYENDNDATSVDVDILIARLTRRISSAKHIEVLTGIIQGFYAMDVSGVNVVKELIEHQAHVLGMEIAAKLSAGNVDDKILSKMETYKILKQGSLADLNSEDEIFTGVTPKDLVSSHFAKENLIEIWPKTLNDAIDGGAKPGHHVLVFAPTEMGKTLFVINAVAGFLKQGLRVLYCGNEDPAADILMRIMSRLTGMTKYEIRDDPTKTEEILKQRNWDLLTLVSLAPGTFQQIEGLVNEYNPAVVILDQLRNIAVDSENRTQALEKAATAARNLAKGHRVLVLSVTQAADSASRKTVLDRGDVDSSNIGIPGQCDLMIGIGADAQMEEHGLRVLSFPKNKLSGRHTPINVTFNYALSKIEVA